MFHKYNCKSFMKIHNFYRGQNAMRHNKNIYDKLKKLWRAIALSLEFFLYVNTVQVVCGNICGGVACIFPSSLIFIRLTSNGSFVVATSF